MNSLLLIIQTGAYHDALIDDKTSGFSGNGFIAIVIFLAVCYVLALLYKK